ncbi:hypothetical protein HDV01_003467, partial [Terramyces sp. JEL0728]
GNGKELALVHHVPLQFHLYQKHHILQTQNCLYLQFKFHLNQKILKICHLNHKMCHLTMNWKIFSL